VWSISAGDCDERGSTIGRCSGFSRLVFQDVSSAPCTALLCLGVREPRSNAGITSAGPLSARSQSPGFFTIISLKYECAQETKQERQN
jgi:hypothetical protein